ncbi:MAG: phosphoribosyl-ATP diphosphatase [Rickettsiales bacterium]|nr:phosphoribosyl-ATP diphosphatase [Rickettsiales bacterium]
MSKNQLTLEELFALIQDKIKSREKNSYSYQLSKDGIEKITRKIGEEATEVLIAAFIHDQKKQQKTHDDLIGEVCDLFYHILVLLASQDIEFQEILSELNRRNKKL